MSKEKENVSLSYDKIADWFDTHCSRDMFEKPWIDKALRYLKPGDTILDVGCGMGEPFARYFIEQGYKVPGFDGSRELIQLAQSRLGDKGTFFKADMREVSLNQQFNMVIAWDSFFHLSPTDQRKIFPVFAHHLQSNGILLFTSGSKAGEVWGDNGGEELYHASLSPEEYKESLAAHGFQVLDYTLDDPIYFHTIWLARYKPL